MRSTLKPSNRQMSVVVGTRLAWPFAQRPNAQRSDGIGVLAPPTVLRTVSVERAGVHVGGLVGSARDVNRDCPRAGG